MDVLYIITYIDVDAQQVLENYATDLSVCMLELEIYDSNNPAELLYEMHLQFTSIFTRGLGIPLYGLYRYVRSQRVMAFGFIGYGLAP